MKYYINSYVTNVQIVENSPTTALALVRSGQILLNRKEINAFNISRFELAFQIVIFKISYPFLNA